jgi:hypothetical protein
VQGRRDNKEAAVPDPDDPQDFVIGTGVTDSVNKCVEIGFDQDGNRCRGSRA